MGSATLYSGTDAWVNSTKPNATAALGSWLRVRNPGSATYLAYIRPNNPCPRGATLTSVKLHLFSVGVFTGTPTIQVQRISSPWTDSKLTYNNRPSVAGTVVSLTQGAAADGTEFVFDLTAIWQTIVNGSPNYGVRIMTTSTNEYHFHSYQSGDFKPVWEFTWSDAPDAPTELSPAGGAASTLSKPTLLFNFHDVSGNTSMASLQVQINPTNSFTAPAFDSNEVASSDPQLDLTTTTYAGLAIGASGYWRVRVKDGAGIWSAWSDPALFKRVAAGSLTLNSPTGGIVYDTTQDVIWSNAPAGIVQTAWQVILADDANPTKPLVDTGRRSGTTNTYTIPKGLIKSENAFYRLTVRTWDDLSRVSTPGDKVYQEVVTTFQFSDSRPAAAITGFAISPRSSQQPGLWLDWDMAAAPDFFEIRRGTPGSMDVLDTDLLPVDLLSSGTHYHWLDKTAPPFLQQTYRVVAKTTGGISISTSASGSFTLDATWLEDYDQGKLVPIMYREGASDGVSNWDAPQIGVVAQPNSAKRVIRMTQGQAGLQGSIAGVIVDSYGVTADVWRKNLEWMRDRPGNQVHLNTGGRSILVVLGDIVIVPYKTKEDQGRARIVTMNFWEQ